MVFFTAMTFFSYNVLNLTLLKYVSMSTQEDEIRTKIININNDKFLFYHCSIEANKRSGSCNNINDPYSKLYVPDVFKNINVKLFNLMSRTNETRHIKWDETSKCKCWIDRSVCSNKQRYKNDKCRCECKELIDSRRWDKEFIWNPSNCECEFN